MVNLSAGIILMQWKRVCILAKNSVSLYQLKYLNDEYNL